MMWIFIELTTTITVTETYYRNRYGPYKYNQDQISNDNEIV